MSHGNFLGAHLVRVQCIILGSCCQQNDEPPPATIEPAKPRALTWRPASGRKEPPRSVTVATPPVESEYFTSTSRAIYSKREEWYPLPKDGQNKIDNRVGHAQVNVNCSSGEAKAAVCQGPDESSQEGADTASILLLRQPQGVSRACVCCVGVFFITLMCCDCKSPVLILQVIGSVFNKYPEKKPLRKAVKPIRAASVPDHEEALTTKQVLNTTPRDPQASVHHTH